VNIDVDGLMRALGIDARRRGQELWARCPYPGHEGDGTPSWSIVDSPGDDRHGLHHCFGCAAGGGALDLVLELVGLSGYAAAAAWVRERGLDVDDEQSLEVELRLRRPRRMADGMPVPRCVWFGDLAAWPTPARRYAAERGLTAAQIERWGIGYAVDGELAGRVWVPTRDRAGVLRDWTARSYCGEEPRYRNAGGGGLRSAVFGERWWPDVRARAEAELVLCEGAFDALACERAGARYVGALSGVARYDRWTMPAIAGWQSVVVAVDPDDAGDRVAEMIDMLGRIPGERNIHKVDLPAGVDCAALWRRDPRELERRLRCAQ